MGRTELTEFRYVAGELILSHRHEGKWVGLMNATYLQLGISDEALMAASDREVELRMYRKFADPRLRGLVAAVHADGGWVSERAVISGFCRTGHSRGANQWSCGCARTPGIILGALAKVVTVDLAAHPLGAVAPAAGAILRKIAASRVASKDGKHPAQSPIGCRSGSPDPG